MNTVDSYTEFGVVIDRSELESIDENLQVEIAIRIYVLWSKKVITTEQAQKYITQLGLKDYWNLINTEH